MGRNKNKIKYKYIFCNICTECISKDLRSPDTLCKHSQETNKVSHYYVDLLYIAFCVQ